MASKHQHDNILVALAGQPNVGKSTVFNMLTGAQQHIANFPGLTVEKKEGVYAHENRRHEIVDLPGTYSLTSYSQEERVTRDFILLERPEVVVAVVDAANLMRNLLLVIQLREMGVPLVVCLNMMDVAEQREFQIDTARLGETLAVPVVPVVAKHGRGREALRAAIHEVASTREHAAPPWALDYGAELAPELRELTARLEAFPHLMEDFSARWLAVKLMEGDTEARRIIQHHIHEDEETARTFLAHADLSRQRFAEVHGRTAIKVVADTRYAEAERITELCVDRSRVAERTLSDRIDAVLLHPWLEVPLLILFLLLFYLIAMGLGEYLAERCAPLLNAVQQGVGALFPPHPQMLRTPWLEGLVVDGLAEGVLSLLYFVPIFFLLFALIAVVEDSGYMARIAFVMDRFLRRFGLQGQSTLPLLLSGALAGGCTVPGILATRTMKDQRSRLLTILVLPLLNCGGKIAIYIFIVELFFAAYRPLVLLGMSLFTIAMALLAAKALSLTLVRGQEEPFMLELPPYRLPTARGVLRQTGVRLWSFVRKVVTVVAAFQVIFFCTLHLPGLGLERELDFQSRLDAALRRMHADAGAQNHYRPLLDGPSLRALLDYRARLTHALEQAGDENERERIAERFRAENREFHRLNRPGDSPDDTEAARARQAFARYARTLQTLRTQRQHELTETSLAGRAGKALEPVSRLAGFDWRINLAVITSLPARENLVATLELIFQARKPADTPPAPAPRAYTRWPAPHALALLVFVALLPPCLPTVALLKAETRSWRWTVFASVYPLVLSYAMAVLVFQLGAALGG